MVSAFCLVGIFYYDKKMELFDFELEENNEPIETININSFRVYVSNEQKELIEKSKKYLFKKNNVDNLSDYLLKKIYEDINSK